MPIDPRQKELWLNELMINGFITLRNFLPVELVEGMYEQLLPILRGEHARAVADNFKEGRGSGRLAIDLTGYARVLQGPLASVLYHRNPVIEEMVDAVFTPYGAWRRVWTNVEAVFHGSQYMGWHSDQRWPTPSEPDGRHRSLRLTYNIPLVDFRWSNGAMSILPGTHHLPRSFSATRPVIDIPNVYPVSLDLQRGDALLRDGNTLHRGTPNLTDEPRPMLDQTYELVLAEPATSQPARKG